MDGEMGGATNIDELMTFSKVNSVGNFHCACNYKHDYKWNFQKQTMNDSRNVTRDSYLLLRLPEKVWVRRLFRKSRRL